MNRIQNSNALGIFLRWNDTMMPHRITRAFQWPWFWAGRPHIMQRQTYFKWVFSCPEQLNRWPCHWLTEWLLILTLQSDPRDLWHLRHLIRVMRRHDLTKKYLPTFIPTHLPPTYVPPLENRRYHRDFRHLRHWLQYWQLRTWINDNLCYLTINCDTGQHS